MKFCIYIYNVYIDVRQETETKLTDYERLFKIYKQHQKRHRK